MKLLKKINLKFPDARKEEEYMTIRRQAIRWEFKMAMAVIILVLISIWIEVLARLSIKSLITTSAFLAVFTLLTFLGLYYQKSIKLIIVLGILGYNFLRLLLLKYDYAHINGVVLFYTGYGSAIFDIFLLKCMTSTLQRTLLVFSLYFLRAGMLVFWIDMKALSIGLFLRGFLISIFMIYFFHMEEKLGRKVFLNFDEKRDELLKFKELLADYLPLGILVVDYKDLKPLFSNHAFLNLFDSSQSTLDTLQAGNNNSPSSNPNQFIKVNDDQLSSYIRSLYADETTIRENGVDQPEPEPKSFDVNKNLRCLEEILKDITQAKLLLDKALSLAAVEKDIANPRTFDVIVKKVQWNGIETMAIVLNDITYQEKLLYWKMTNTNKDKIIATVSHELRTPLNGIIGLLEMSESKIENTEALELIALSKDNASLLLSLVNSILDLHQIREGKLKLIISKINIRKCLHGITRLFHFQTNQKGIYLTLSVDDNAPLDISTDENRLKQIIINLIGNALKFTSEGGVTISMKESLQGKDCLTISVTDTGLGIKEEDIGKLFQRFGRLEDGEGVNKSGVGLGLVISNVLAVMLSGKKDPKGIQVTSQYGKGSSFSFDIQKDLNPEIDTDLMSRNKTEKEERSERFRTEINLESFVRNSISFEKEELSENIFTSEEVGFKMSTYKSFYNPTLPSQNTLQANNSPSPSHQTIDSLKEHVLIVDDNPFNLLVTGNLVKEAGYIVKTASGGYEAIKKMEDFTKENQRVRAILMDCQMPVIDGYETSKLLIQMMQEGKADKIPILALTANCSEEDVNKCLECGMIGHLTKPISKKELLEALGKLQC